MSDNGISIMKECHDLFAEPITHYHQLVDNNNNNITKLWYKDFYEAKNPVAHRQGYYLKGEFSPVMLSALELINKYVFNYFI